MLSCGDDNAWYLEEIRKFVAEEKNYPYSESDFSDSDSFDEIPVSNVRSKHRRILSSSDEKSTNCSSNSDSDSSLTSEEVSPGHGKSNSYLNSSSDKEIVVKRHKTHNYFSSSSSDEEPFRCHYSVNHPKSADGKLILKRQYEVNPSVISPSCEESSKHCKNSYSDSLTDTSGETSDKNFKNYDQVVGLSTDKDIVVRHGDNDIHQIGSSSAKNYQSESKKHLAGKQIYVVGPYSRTCLVKKQRKKRINEAKRVTDAVREARKKLSDRKLSGNVEWRKGRTFGLSVDSGKGQLHGNQSQVCDQEKQELETHTDISSKKMELTVSKEMHIRVSDVNGAKLFQQVQEVLDGIIEPSFIIGKSFKLDCKALEVECKKPIVQSFDNKPSKLDLKVPVQFSAVSVKEDNVKYALNLHPKFEPDVKKARLFDVRESIWKPSSTGEPLKPKEGLTGEPLKHKDGVTGEPAKPKDSVTGELRKPKDGVTGEPCKPKEVLPGEPLKPKDGVTGEPRKPKDDRIGEPRKPKDGVTGEPRKPKESLPGEPLKPKDGVTGERHRPKDSVTGEPSKPKDGVTSDPRKPKDGLLGLDFPSCWQAKACLKDTSKIPKSPWATGKDGQQLSHSAVKEKVVAKYIKPANVSLERLEQVARLSVKGSSLYVKLNGLEYATSPEQWSRILKNYKAD